MPKQEKSIYKNKNGERLGFLLLRFPELLALLVAYGYALVILNNLREDTTGISNVAFGVMATLAALSFGLHASLHSSEKIKDKVLFAGERFFHGALLVLIASLIKYGVLELTNTVSESFPSNPIMLIIEIMIGFFAGFLFLQAVLIAHSGIKTLNKLLINRMTRDKHWDHFFS